MVLLPEKELTTENAIEAITTTGLGRPYLGMSSIGKKCLREMWLSFHWCVARETSARSNRIFERGDLEEARIIRDLKAVGIEVYRKDGDENIEIYGTVGETQEEIIGFAGHSKGHIDGRCSGVIEAPKTEHLLEIKTCADKYFGPYKKHGLKIANEGYYDQVTRYMGGLKLKRCLFIITNKNNEERYYERVKFDQLRYENLLEKERSIIFSEFAPRKEFKSSWYLCRMCNKRFLCHHNEPAEINCRTCKFCDLGDDGKWFCSLQNDKELSVQEQRKGCKLYKVGIEAE